MGANKFSNALNVEGGFVENIVGVIQVNIVHLVSSTFQKLKSPYDKSNNHIEIW